MQAAPVGPGGKRQAAGFKAVVFERFRGAPQGAPLFLSARQAARTPATYMENLWPQMEGSVLTVGV